MNITHEMTLPASGLASNKMPGHWLLARAGKRVLRPGGRALTRRMLEALAIQPSDQVVEFAPGLGLTARLTLQRRPAAYRAIEQDESAAARVRQMLDGQNQQCLVGNAMETGLPAASATVVYGEAMLSMQGPEQKRRIAAEAHRLLKSGGRYAIHELAFLPDDLNEDIQQEIRQALSQAIHVGVRPVTAADWRTLLKKEGFEVRTEVQRPMRLLEPGRVLQDEGPWGALKFGWNLLRDPEARRRVSEMRRVFLKYRSHLAALMLVGVKRAS